MGNESGVLDVGLYVTAKMPPAPAGYHRLMQLGRDVIAAERTFGAGSPQHVKVAAAWKRQQKKMGVTP